MSESRYPSDGEGGQNKKSERKRLAEFVFEAGMLRRTPRSGYQFLGSGHENVAEHSFRVAIIGYLLAKMAGCNAEHTATLCLFHDFHEARTGDFNYVNYVYNSSKAREAMVDATRGNGLENDILNVWEEQEEEVTQEAKLAHDADQLDLIFNLLREKKFGNPYAESWLVSALKRLVTEEGKSLAEEASTTDPESWWFIDPANEWWVKKGK